MLLITSTLLLCTDGFICSLFESDQGMATSVSNSSLRATYRSSLPRSFMLPPLAHLCSQLLDPRNSARSGPLYRHNIQPAARERSPCHDTNRSESPITRFQVRSISLSATAGEAHAAASSAGMEIFSLWDTRPALCLHRNPPHPALPQPLQPPQGPFVLGRA